MDPSLSKERAAFQKRALQMMSMTLEGHSHTPTTSSTSAEAAIPAKSAKPSASASKFDYKTSDSRPQNLTKFNILQKVVNYMKARHLSGSSFPLSVDEILEEANCGDVPTSTITWLENEALPQNPKLSIVEGKKFVYRPKFDIRNRADLFRLLRQYDKDGLGGILMDDVADSVDGSDKLIQSLGDNVIKITRVNDKRIILYYNDKSLDYHVDEEFRKMWRSTSLDGVTDKHVEDYLRSKNIATMSGERRSFVPCTSEKKGFRQRRRAGPVRLKDNEHMEGVLEDYSEMYDKKS